MAAWNPASDHHSVGAFHAPLMGPSARIDPKTRPLTGRVFVLSPAELLDGKRSRGIQGRCEGMLARILRPPSGIAGRGFETFGPGERSLLVINIPEEIKHCEGPACQCSLGIRVAAFDAI
jgi:hypothetical protein